MNDKTLREVCQTFGVSRRAVQGYEKAGLVAATGKNERGYLLYDEKAQERIRRIRLFQQMGFSLKEIQQIMDAPNHVLKASLEKQMRKLKEERSSLEMLIQEIHKLIASL